MHPLEPAIAPIELLYRFGAALVIGFLVGLQREYAHLREEDEGAFELFAGARTFALLGLFGCGAAFLGGVSGEMLVFAALLLVIGAMIGVAYFTQAARGEAGMTTETAAALTVVTGALCAWGYIGLAVALGVATTVILAAKLQTRTFARRLSREDVYATLKFAVISAIVLPVLPREGLGPPPFDVLSPYKIWLMVVFISGISFLGYVLIKVVGTRRGVGLTGLLGGLASSTAVTLTFAQRSRTAPSLAKPFALAILLAWIVMFARVLVEVAVINRTLLGVVWLPMTTGAGAALAYCAYLYFSRTGDGDGGPDHFKNPFELGPAISFGLLYAVILVLAHAARMYFGDTGLYLSSVASGLADVDAITLSMAELSKADGGLALRTAARAIVLAVTANTLVKGGIVLSLGAPALRKTLFPGMLLTLAVTLAVGLLG